MNRAVEANILTERDFMTLSEKEILVKLEAALADKAFQELKSLYTTFRTMESIKHTEQPLENHFCVKLKVKQRYIDPLFISGKPLSQVSKKAKAIIDDFLAWEDKPWGCVPLVG